MQLIYNPLYLGIFSVFLLLLLVAQESFYRFKKYLRLKAFLALLFIIICFLMMQPYQNPQPRFEIGNWNYYLAGLFIAFTLIMFIASSLELFEVARESSHFSTEGIYSIIRNPLHLGIIFLLLGLIFLFQSVYGLVLFLLWLPGIIFHIIAQEQNFQDIVGLSYLRYQAQVKHRFLPTLKSKITENSRQFPFRNLVFKGGGVKGIAYKGVLQVLSEYDILDQIDRVAGTSAGAITAMLLSFRLNIEETIQLIDSLKFSQIPDKSPEEEVPVDWAPEFIKKEIDEITGNIESMRRLTKKYGWYSSRFFYNWLKNTIAQYCDGNGMATFQDFHARGFRDLYVVATNITKYKAEVFSLQTTPHTAVADAVRMSMSIPLYFEAMRYNGNEFGDGDFYVDGGMYYNYPSHIFDSAEFAGNNPWYSNGINWETLGFYLYPLEEYLAREKHITDIIEYIERLLDNIAQASDISAMQASTIDSRRTVKISDCNVAPTDFHIDVDHIKYHELVKSGREATKMFLDHFLAPNHIN